MVVCRRLILRENRYIEGLKTVCQIQSMKKLFAYNVWYASNHFARFQYILSMLQEQSAHVIIDPVRCCVFGYSCGSTTMVNIIKKL